MNNGFFLQWFVGRGIAMGSLNHGYLFQNRAMILLLRIKDFIFRLLPKRERLLPEKITKILLIKPDHLGDMLLLTSILPLIRESYPVACIDVVCGRWSRPILDNNPYIRHRILINHCIKNRENQTAHKKVLVFMSDYLSALWRIRRENYDLCLLLRAYGFNLASLAVLSNSKYIVGHGTGGYGPLFDGLAQWKPGLHEVDHFMEVLAKAGIESNGRPFYRIYPDRMDEQIVLNLLEERLGERAKFAIVHPGAGDMRKSLRLEDWRKVVNMLSEKGFRTVLTGSVAEKEMAASIALEDSIILCGTLTQLQLAILFQKAAAIVTVDTIASHLGGWSGVPTAVFFCGINDMRQWRPLGEKVRLLVNECSLAPCLNGCVELSCLQPNFQSFAEFLAELS